MSHLPPLPGLDEGALRRELEANHFMRDRRDLRAAPLIRLSGLYDVNWGALSDSYGPAHFVPYFVEALSSPDQEDREWGLGALYASINHQGTPEEASPRAIPFLLELLRAPNLPDRAAVLAFVTEIAVGETRWCCEAGTDIDEFPRTNCYAEVVRGAELFVQFLTHADAAVRAEAARACALLEACALRAESLLLSMAADDPDRGARLVARIALGVVARRNGSDVTDLLRSFGASEDPWERASALAGLAYAAPRGLRAEELRALGRLSRKLPETAPDHLIWDLGTTLDAQFVSASVPPELEAKLCCAEGKLDAVAIECAKRAFGELVPKDADSNPEPWLPSDVRPELLRLLRTIAADEKLFGHVFGYDWYVPLELPRSREHLLRWLGIETGPLDQVLEFVPDKHWPIWRGLYAVLAGELDQAAWSKTVAGVMDPAARIRLVEDAIANMRWFSALGRLRRLDYRERNGHESRALILLAHLIAGTDAGVAWAREQATTLLAGDRRKVLNELVVVITLATAARARGEWLEQQYEALLNLDQAPVSVYARALGEAAAVLDPSRKEGFVASLPLHKFSTTSQASTDPETGKERDRVECRYIYFLPFWETLPSLAGPTAARRVLEVLAEDQAHRREHAGRPERLRFRGCTDEEFPRELALRTIVATGAEARPLLESYREQLDDKVLVDEALTKLSS